MTEFNIRIMPRQSGKTAELKRIYKDLKDRGYNVFYIVPHRNMKDREIPSRTFEEIRVHPDDILLIDELFMLQMEKIELYSHEIKRARLVYIRSSPYENGLANMKLVVDKEYYPEYFI